MSMDHRAPELGVVALVVVAEPDQVVVSLAGELDAGTQAGMDEDRPGRIQQDGQALDAKGRPGSQRAGLYPWFEVPGMKSRDTRIVCGHWSALGRFAGLGVYAIDTGCVWGGKLTALRLDGDEPQFIAVDAEPHRKRD